ncbi:hypothetical protein PoB_004020200 [Plakobranchus ocellatus]|uniref:Uncharacterized protein n=1 Tax=Plakobranchus ocellatus TaxID=259542 RepID=A0AAV4B3I4_9GAST|nr:hypothetical protein PoB_004020200 [Plakobranchus ocellatus]
MKSKVIRPSDIRQPGAELSQSCVLDKLDRAQNALYWGLYGAPQLGSWSSQTVLAQERYLRTGEGAPLKTMVEEFATQHRRIKKTSVLSVAHDISRKYSVPTVS